MDELIRTLDTLLIGDQSGIVESRCVDDFLNSDALFQHFKKTTETILSRIKAGAPAFDNSDESNPSVLYHSSGKINKTLLIQSSGNRLGFLTTYPNKYLVIPLDKMGILSYKIEGADGQDIYAKPSKNLRLSFNFENIINRPEIYARRNMLELADLNPEKKAKYLIYIVGNSQSSFQLTFSRENQLFIGTSMTDAPSAKAITFLEILENLSSRYLPEVSYGFTKHYSAIVRWRALSSMNKISHPKLEEVLHSYCEDEASFIRDAARAVISKGKR